MELEFWQSTGIDPYYMYLENTLELVDQEYVERNNNLMKTRVKKVKVDDDEIYEFDEDGDLMSLVFD